MKVEELKKIPIKDLLTHLGYNPVSRSKGGRQLMYHSPLREDNNASFSVSTNKNIWYDFGTGKGGNVIDLAKALTGGCSFQYAASWLEEQSRSFGQNPSPSCSTNQPPQKKDDSEMKIIRVVRLTHQALLDYLWSRGIPAEIGQRFCKEVHYTVHGKEYFGICFMNILGGMEIRNPFFKGAYGVKAPSIIHVEKERRTSACCVFEGFMDFLSYQTLKIQNDDKIIQPFPCDCIVLNSTSLLNKTIPFIGVYECAFCYLDNDTAGEQASTYVQSKVSGAIIQMSRVFNDYKDVNDYLVHSNAPHTNNAIRDGE